MPLHDQRATLRLVPFPSHTTARNDLHSCLRLGGDAVGGGTVVSVGVGAVVGGVRHPAATAWYRGERRDIWGAW